MCSQSKEQSILSRRQFKMHFIFLNYAPFFDLDILSSIKHLTAEHWHPHVVLLFKPFPRQNSGPDQIESICRQQIKCNKNDNFCL